MFDFIKLQFLKGNIDSYKVLSYAPRWLTQEQAQEIIDNKKAS